MTFVVTVMVGVGMILVFSAIEDVSIADTIRGFINGEIAKKATAPATPSTTTTSTQQAAKHA